MQLFVEHRADFLSHLILSHLSNNNNTPELVEDMFSTVAGNTQIIVASRHTATPLYSIAHNNKILKPLQGKALQPKPQQLAFF